jgi:hypothetical protein
MVLAWELQFPRLYWGERETEREGWPGRIVAPVTCLGQSSLLSLLPFLGQDSHLKLVGDAAAILALNRSGVEGPLTTGFCLQTPFPRCPKVCK